MAAIGDRDLSGPWVNPTAIGPPAVSRLQPACHLTILGVTDREAETLCHVVEVAAGRPVVPGTLPAHRRSMASATGIRQVAAWDDYGLWRIDADACVTVARSRSFPPLVASACYYAARMGPDQTAELLGRIHESLGTKVVEASELVVELLRAVGEGFDHGRSLAVAERMTRHAATREASVGDWLAQMASMFSEGPSTGVGGLIAGVALTDRPTARAMASWGLLVDERIEGWRAQLSDAGRARLAEIPLASVAEQEPIALLHGDGLGSVALSPDGRRALTAGRSGIVHWNVESGRQLCRIRPERRPLWVTFDGAGRSALSRLSDGDVVQYSLSTATASRSIAVGGLTFVSRDGSRILVADGRNSVAIDISNGARHPLPQVVTRGAWSAAGERLVVVGDGEAASYVVATDDLGPRVPLPVTLAGKEVVSIAVGADWVALANERDIDVVELRTGSYHVIPTRARRLAMSGDDRLLAVVTMNGQVQLLNVESGTVVGELTSVGRAEGATFSLDGTRLVTRHDDGTARVWDVGLTRRSGPPPAATYHADVTDGADLLDRARDADAFASLIAARTVQAPLSIGVFGEWGSGKSWFMRRVRQRVATIAADARLSGADQRELTFYRHIAQVDFNAWQYAEGDVLASLVQEIFRRLDLGEDDASITEQERRKLLAAFHAAEATVAVAKLEIVRLEDVAREQEQNVEKRRAKAQADEVLKSTARDALGAIDSELSDTGLRVMVSELTQGIKEADRARGLLGPLLTSAQKVAVTCTLALGVAIAAIAGLLVDNLGPKIASLAATATGAVGAVKWVRSKVLAPVLAKLTEARDSANRQLDKELAGPREDAARARRVAEVAREDLATRRARLDAASPERMIGDLIEARLAGGTYTKHLGLVSQVRDDFAQLSELIQLENDRLLRPDEHVNPDHLQVSRIVLYIDDLDRCASDKVARVLQAVHLLLAFPMFVVVVGVDSRWVARALQRHFPELLDEDGATPNDYLEKIFQIPFWLDRLDPPEALTMLEGLVATSDAPVTRTGPDGPPRFLVDGRSTTPSDTGPSAEPPSHRPVSLAARSTDLNPRGLQITEQEVEAIRLLAPLLGRSPRALKSFVNIYRIVKVRADDSLEFVEDRGADSAFKAAGLLLAIAMGFPREARRVFDALRHAADTDATADVLATVPGVSGWNTLVLPSVAACRKWLEEVAHFGFRVDPTSRATDGCVASEDDRRPYKAEGTGPSEDQHADQAAGGVDDLPSVSSEGSGW